MTTEHPAVIFSVNLALVAACYAFYIAQGDSNDGAGAEVCACVLVCVCAHDRDCVPVYGAFWYLTAPYPQPRMQVEIKGLLKYLDYGSGKERGARK